MPPKSNLRLASAELPAKPPDIELIADKPEWQLIWRVSRALLTLWAVAVWVLLVCLPGLEQIQDVPSAALHAPYILIGLVLVGAVLAAYNLNADGHLLWFLGVLLLLAGWI